MPSSGSCRASAARTRSWSSTRSGSSASATRTASGRSSWAGCPAPDDTARSPELWPADRATRGRLVPELRDGRPRHRRRRVRPRRGARRDRRPRGGQGAALGPVRRRRRRRCACSSSSTSPARTRTCRAATCTRSGAGWAMELAARAPGRHRPRDARAGHRRARRGRLRGGVRDPVPRGPGPQPLHGPDVHPAVPDDAPAGRHDEAEPAPRGRPGQAPHGRRRLDRARARRPSRSSRSCARAGRRRGPRPDQRTADLPPLLLRHRHPGRDRAHRGPHSIEEIREFIGADSLGYLSIRGVLAALDLPYERFCFACFDGNYPEPVPYDVAARKFILEEAPVGAPG